MAHLAYIYLTPNKLYLMANAEKKDAFEVDWNGVELVKTLSEIKEELKIDSVKAVTTTADLKAVLQSACKENNLQLLSVQSPEEVTHTFPLYPIINQSKPPKIEEKPEEKEEPAPFTPREKKSKKTLIVIILISLLLVLALAGGFWISRQAVSQKEEPTPTPTPAPTAIPTPTPEPVDFSTYSIQIQNGSGTVGLAGKVGSLLEEEGFEDISAANADSYDYQETIIQVKEEVPDQVYQTINQALADQYTTQKESLPASSDYDIIIILGETK